MNESDFKDEDPSGARRGMDDDEESTLLRQLPKIHSWSTGKFLRRYRVPALCTCTAICGLVVGASAPILNLAAGLQPFAKVLSSSRPAIAVHAVRACNPYSLPGLLQVDTSVQSENYYVPYDSHCVPVDFLERFNTSTGSSTDIDLDFLQNKRLLMLGDSVDRQLFSDFMNTIGASTDSIGRDHPNSPPVADGVIYGDNFKSRPIVGTLASSNFTAVFTFIYGLEGCSTAPSHFYYPLQLEDRVEDISKVLLQGPPDVIVLSSMFWDSLRIFNEAVKVHDGTRLLNIGNEEAKLIETRVEAIFHYLQTTWNVADPLIMWRTVHHPRQHTITPAPLLHAISVISLRTVESIIRRMSLSHLKTPVILRWGEIFQGQEQHQSDEIHPKFLPGGYLFGNMVLDVMHSHFTQPR